MKSGKTIVARSWWQVRRWQDRMAGPATADGPPRGLFRESEAVESGRIEGGFLCRHQSIPPPSDEARRRLSVLGQLDHAGWPVVWSRRREARLCGPSLVHLDDRGRACWEAMFGPQAWGDPVWHRRPLPPPERLCGSWTSIVSRWDDGSNYYHWITDGLTRLMHLDRFPPETQILIRPPRHRFVQESLEALGLWGRAAELAGEHFRVEDYWFAGPTAITGCPNPLGVRWLRGRIGVPEKSSAGGSRVFVTRRNTSRRVVNLDEVESSFRRRGWQVVDPAELSFGQQVALFSQASEVAGIHGAGMTNIIWAPAGIRVTEFMPRSFRNGCYEGISLVLGHRHRVVPCPSDRAGNMRVTLDDPCDE